MGTTSVLPRLKVPMQVGVSRDQVDLAGAAVDAGGTDGDLVDGVGVDLSHQACWTSRPRRLAPRR